MDYKEFLSQKVTAAPSRGFQIAPAEVHPTLFPFQRDIVVWALRKGAAAIFAKMGLGKTFMQIEWARIAAERTGGKILIACPLGVTKQTIKEAAKLGVPVRYVRSQAEADASPEASRWRKKSIAWNSSATAGPGSWRQSHRSPGMGLTGSTVAG